MARIFLLSLPLCLLLAPSYPGCTLDVSTLTTVRVVEDNPAHSSGLPNPEKDPCGFLRACLKRYDDTVEGYTLTFEKQERVAGKLLAREIIKVCYKEKPRSVYFNWQQGKNKAEKALYIEGQNLDQKSGRSWMLVRPTPPLTALGIVKTDPEGSDAKRSGRYPISDFGLKQAMVRVLKTWESAEADNALKVEYNGLNKVQELGGKTYHTFFRKHPDRPEEDDGATEVLIYIDSETLLQAGSIVRNVKGELLGEYFFQDIHLNPTFDPGQFELSALKK